jgi:type I restriction enzyme S subunit
VSWPEVPIGEVCALVNGRAFKPTDWTEHGLPIVRIQNLNNESAPFNRFDGAVRERFLIESGALLFSWSGTPGTSFGAFFWHRGPAVLNQHIFHVIVRGGVDANYLRYALNARIDSIIAQAHGGVGLQHITKDKLEATTVPLPPLPEQLRIADILDRADEVRRKRQGVVALTGELFRSAFLEMFGDPVTNPRGWPISTLREVTTVITDGEHATPERDTSGVMLLSARNIQNGFLDLRDGKVDYVPPYEWERIRSRCAPVRGDVLLSCSGSIGRVTVVRIDAPFGLVRSVAMLRLKGDVILPEYLEALLWTPHLQRTMLASANQSAQANLFLGQIGRLLVTVPPLREQQRCVELSSRVRHLQASLLCSTQQLDALFDSLVQRAFRGELTAPTGKPQLRLFGESGRHART